MYKYRNESEKAAVVLVGIGLVKPGQEFLSRILIENPHIKLLEEVVDSSDDNKVRGVESMQPGAVTEARPPEENK